MNITHRYKVGELNIGDKFVHELMFHPVMTPLHTVIGKQGTFVLCRSYNGTPEALRENDEVTLVFPSQSK